MNQTTIPQPKLVERKWYLVDAKELVLGKLATFCADSLRGKNKKDYQNHVDSGDFIVVVNAKDIVLTGDKLDKKIYYNHSQYPGGLRARTARVMKENYLDEMIRTAVYGMLPKNRLRDKQIKRLFIYDSLDHPHQAQEINKIEVK